MEKNKGRQKQINWKIDKDKWTKWERERASEKRNEANYRTKERKHNWLEHRRFVRKVQWKKSSLSVYVWNDILKTNNSVFFSTFQPSSKTTTTIKKKFIKNEQINFLFLFGWVLRTFFFQFWIFLIKITKHTHTHHSIYFPIPTDAIPGRKKKYCENSPCAFAISNSIVCCWEGNEEENQSRKKATHIVCCSNRSNRNNVIDSSYVNLVHIDRFTQITRICEIVFRMTNFFPLSRPIVVVVVLFASDV